MSTRVDAARKSKFSTSYMMKVAVLGAMSWVIMFLEIAIPIFPGFLKMDLSDLVPLIGALSMGPVAGILIELVKNVLHLLINSSTGGVGELANFIVGAAFCASAALYYQHNRTRRGAIIGMAIATVTMITAGAIVNYFVTIPLYGIVLGLSEEVIVGMGSAVIPAIHDRLTLIIFAFCPFNLLKCIIITVFTIPLYKKVSPILRNKL